MPTTTQLSENSHQGFDGLKLALCLASMDAKSNPASGIPVCLWGEGIRSRSSGKERDAETANVSPPLHFRVHPFIPPVPLSEETGKCIRVLRLSSGFRFIFEPAFIIISAKIEINHTLDTFRAFLGMGLFPEAGLSHIPAAWHAVTMPLRRFMSFEGFFISY